MPWEAFQLAVDTLRRFNLVLILELLESADPMIAGTLGWTEPARQVLPHDKQMSRADKASKRARAALRPEVWARLSEVNVFDLLLYHWARRLYLERLVCED